MFPACYKRFFGQTIVLLSIVILASVFACVGYVVAGRIVGLSITALCSGTMAFFLCHRSSHCAFHKRTTSSLLSSTALGD